MLLLVVSLTPELIDYLDSLANGDYLRIVPLGMCHVAVYATSFLMLKYNRKLHIIAITLAAGGALSVIMPAPLNAASLSTMGPYHFYVTHI